MITININDPDLEKRIADKAHSIGKSIHEIVAELLSNALTEKNQVQNYEALDPKEYGYYVTCNEESISGNENEEQFSHIRNQKNRCTNNVTNHPDNTSIIIAL